MAKIIKALVNAGTVALLGFEVGHNALGERNDNKNEKDENHAQITIIWAVLLLLLVIAGILTKMCIRKKPIIA